MSGYGQQQMMSTEAVVRKTVLNGEEKDEEEHEWLFENSIYVDIFNAFIDYRPPSGNGDI